MEQTERIKHMEQCLNRATAALEELSTAMDKYAEAQDSIHELESYLSSKEWKEDFEDDEAGRLPKGLRRGVLSEDGIWNVLEKHKALKAQIQKMAKDSLNG